MSSLAYSQHNRSFLLVVLDNFGQTPFGVVRVLADQRIRGRAWQRGTRHAVRRSAAPGRGRNDPDPGPPSIGKGRSLRFHDVVLGVAQGECSRRPGVYFHFRFGALQIFDGRPGAQSFPSRNGPPPREGQVLVEKRRPLGHHGEEVWRGRLSGWGRSQDGLIDSCRRGRQWFGSLWSYGRRFLLRFAEDEAGFGGGGFVQTRPPHVEPGTPPAGRVLHEHREAFLLLQLAHQMALQEVFVAEIFHLKWTQFSNRTENIVNGEFKI